MQVDTSKHVANLTTVVITNVEEVPYQTYCGYESGEQVECLEYSGLFLINEKLYTYADGCFGFLKPVKRKTLKVKELELVIKRKIERVG